MRHLPHAISLSAAALLCVDSVQAQTLDVAIVAAATTSTTDCRFTDTQSMIQGTGMFASVDVINAASSTPTLADLMQYDAVITWSNTSYFDSIAFGDVLADYVDAGGGVVVATFANAVASTTLSLQGRWQGAYEVIEDQSGQTSGQASLGTVLVPTHPIMAGVGSFDGGSSSYRPTVTTLASGATAIAEWDDGRVLVAVGAMPNRVDLGFYPPSSLCRADFWDATTDGATLMGNALTFAAGGGLGTNYCMANANSTGASAVMSVAGSSSVAANDLTLRGDNLPVNSFSFFITSRQQGFVANPNGSQGNLCLGGAIGRYVGAGQIQQAGASGHIELMIDLTQVPQPNGFEAAMAGDSWSFQAWYRDALGGQATSNFTDGVEVVFN